MTVIEGLGTPEAAWTAWDAPASWPVLDLARLPARIVVVAPHPDDEVLGVGGLLHRMSVARVATSIVAVTDGEGSHPGSPTRSPDGLRGARRAERVEALRRLGAGAAEVHCLHLPDGAVAASEAELADRLAGLLQPADWCIATWAGDGHPDHEATGRAAARAASARGARLLEMPVWTWHWAVPGDDRVPWDRARRIPLTTAALRAKRHAVDAFATQVAPLSEDPADATILPPAVLARLLRPFETVFE